MDRVFGLIKKSIINIYQFIFGTYQFIFASLFIVFIGFFAIANLINSEGLRDFAEMIGRSIGISPTEVPQEKKLIKNEDSDDKKTKAVKEKFYHLDENLEKFSKIQQEAAEILKDSNIDEGLINKALKERKIKNGKFLENLLQKTSEYYQKKRVNIAAVQGKIAEGDNRWREARDYYNKAIELAPKDIRYLSSAGWMEFALENYPRAKELFLEALDRHQRTLGEGHSDTQVSRNNLALFYNKQGLYKDAEPLLLKVLDHCERTLGAEHLDTQASLNNLAVLYYQQGRYAEAEPFFLKVLDHRQRTLGAEHLDTRAIREKLAVIHYQQGSGHKNHKK